MSDENKYESKWEKHLEQAEEARRIQCELMLAQKADCESAVRLRDPDVASAIAHREAFEKHCMLTRQLLEREVSALERIATALEKPVEISPVGNITVKSGC